MRAHPQKIGGGQAQGCVDPVEGLLAGREAWQYNTAACFGYAGVAERTSGMVA